VTKYARGRRYEYKTIELFESMGEQCIARNAGSHRISDLVFATPDYFRLVQVKSGHARLSEAELAKFHQLHVPKDTKLTLVSWSVVKGKALSDVREIHQVECPDSTPLHTERKPVRRQRNKPHPR
jgi:hypothetical protein